MSDDAPAVEKPAVDPKDVTNSDKPVDAPVLPSFRLTHEDDTGVIQATDELHARALWNDQRSKWPSPSLVKCERLD